MARLSPKLIKIAQDVIINPLITPEELALKYEVDHRQITQILTRYDFCEYVRDARGQLIDPGIEQFINGELAAVIEKSMQIIARHLDGPHAHEYALRVLHATTRVVRAEVNKNGVRVLIREE